MSGRTSWWGKDVAWHRRELIVELGDEFGAGGLTVMDVLSAWSKEQRAELGGNVRNGFRTLAREAYVSVDEARAIVSHAAEIGALDDLVIDEDGRRFSLRVSGFAADQDKSAAAFRKQASRARAEGESQNDGPERDTSQPDTPERDKSQGEGPDRDVSRLQDNTPQDREEQVEAADAATPSLPRTSYRGKKVDADTVSAAVRLLDVFNDATQRGLGAATTDGRGSPALKQIAGALLTRPDVEIDHWEQAIRRTVASPPSWVEGPLQIGHIFGERAAEHALAAATGNGNGAAQPSARLADKFGGRIR